MKTIYQEVEAYLRAEPKARERKHKDRAVVNLLVPKYAGVAKALANGSLTKAELTQFVKDHNSYDRAWRKTTETFPELRGTDYDEKAELEIRKQEELGYPVGQHTL